MPVLFQFSPTNYLNIIYKSERATTLMSTHCAPAITADTNAFMHCVFTSALPVCQQNQFDLRCVERNAVKLHSWHVKLSPQFKTTNRMCINRFYKWRTWSLRAGRYCIYWKSPNINLNTCAMKGELLSWLGFSGGMYQQGAGNKPCCWMRRRTRCCVAYNRGQ